MARLLTSIGIISLASAIGLGACGNSDDDGKTPGGPNGDGDGDGGMITGIGDGDGLGNGTPGGNSIIFYETPKGFVNYDDGSGIPAYKALDVTEAAAQSLTTAAASGLTPEANALFQYPLKDTMVPWNLTFINFQWRAPDGSHTTVLVRAKSDTDTYHAYLVAECTTTGFCNVDLPRAEWQTIGLNNTGKSVTFEVISQGADGQAVITEQLPIRFAPEELVGALYFWASADRTIKRASFGADRAVDFITPGVNADYACVSCHSVSRDGSTIAFGVSPEHGENIAGIQVAKTNDPDSPVIVPLNGATPYGAEVSNGNTEGPTTSLGHNVALSPDGSKMAVNKTEPPTNWPSILEIRNTDIADSVVASYEVGHTIFGGDKMAIHTEYSPDGTQLVATLADNDGNMSAWSNTSGSIGVFPVNPDGTLGNVRIISTPTAGAFHFYPTWSPDSKYVAFVTSWDTNDNVGSLGNDHGVIHMVPTAGNTECPGAGCIELTRGTGYGAAEAEAMSGTYGSTWPKFAPFAQGAAQNVYFITFTSRREVGAFGNPSTQLWMFGIDTSVSPDPSFSPFWLPYQDHGDGSLAPYWTETLPCNIEGDTCNGCLDGEVCVVSRDTSECKCEPPIVPK